MPFGHKYSIARQRLRRADPETVDWFLQFIARKLPVDSIDYIILFGDRGIDDPANVETPRGQHRFMVVIRDETPDDVLTGNSGWRAMVDEMMLEAAQNVASHVDIFVCWRTPWDDDVEATGVMAEAQLGTLFVERLDWI